MNKNRQLTPERFAERMNEAGWPVQANGRVLCPRRGAGLSLSTDRARGYLHLKTGTRTVLDLRSLDHVQPPPEMTVDGIRIVSFERADLRDAGVLRDAATLIRDLGETEGVLTRKGGYRDAVEVRTAGVSVALERIQHRGAREVCFLDDPKPARPERRTPVLLGAVLMMRSPAIL